MRDQRNQPTARPTLRLIQGDGSAPPPSSSKDAEAAAAAVRVLLHLSGGLGHGSAMRTALLAAADNLLDAA